MRLAFVCVAMLGLAPVLFAATPTEEVAELTMKSAGHAGRGGLALWLNPSSAKGMVKLAAGSGLYVQGVTSVRERAEGLRVEIKGTGEAERISIVWRRTAHLPYLDNLIGLLVAEGWGEGDLKNLPLSEVMRVVHPWGVAVIGSDAGTDTAALLAEAGKLKFVKAEKLDRKGAWVRLEKQLDPTFGEWNGAALYGPFSSYFPRLSSDQALEPSKEVRWVNSPLWGGRYGYWGEGSYSNEIFVGGRSFHAESDWVGPPEIRQTTLVARDAFNGVVLWRERIPNGGYVKMADDGLVFVTEGKNGIVARDAATGAVVRNYGQFCPTYVLGDKLISGLTVIERESGKQVWSRPYNLSFQPAFEQSMAYAVVGPAVEAINLIDGKTVWKATPKELTDPTGKISGIFKRDVLYAVLDFEENAQKKIRLVAMDPGNGNVIWSDTRPRGWQVFPFSDQVGYLYSVESTDDKGKKINKPMFTLLDSKTGKELKTGPGVGGGPCYGVRATDRYLIGGRATFLDRRTLEFHDVFGVRSMCSIGAVPSYGLLYFANHTCNCYVAMRGIYALSGGSNMGKGEVSPQLMKGAGSSELGSPAVATDWPLYRANAGRGNSSDAGLPAELKPLWSAKLATSTLPQATGAGVLVFVPISEQHRIAALDMASGTEKWTFHTEGRLSMAPTYYNGLLLVGDHAGWVYCLDAATGRLVWQLQAAPEQKYMSAFNQFESAWPVKSGVLMFDNLAYFVAGRCSTMDGGVYLYGVEPATGEVLMKKNFLDNQKWERSPKTADLLLSDGQNLIGWGARLETAKPVAKPAGKSAPAPHPMLKFGGTWQGPNAILDMLATMNPAGNYMKSRPTDGRGPGGDVVCFDKDRSVLARRLINIATGEKDIVQDGRCEVRCFKGGPKTPAAWINQETKLYMRAILLAGDFVYCAGVPEFQKPEEKPALVVLSVADGKELQRLPLESAPTIDGLSAVGGKLILTTVDGRVLCFDKK